MTINQPGTVTQDLYQLGGAVPAYASAHGRGHGHRHKPPALLLARGSASAAAAGKVNVLLRVTVKGRHMLSHSHSLRAVLVTTLKAQLGRQAEPRNAHGHARSLACRLAAAKPSTLLRAGCGRRADRVHRSAVRERRTPGTALGCGKRSACAGRRPRVAATAAGPAAALGRRCGRAAPAIRRGTAAGAHAALHGSRACAGPEPRAALRPVPHGRVDPWHLRQHAVDERRRADPCTGAERASAPPVRVWCASRWNGATR